MKTYRLNTSGCWQMLEENIFPFWLDKMVDQENGGFYGKINGRGIVENEASKSVILNARILWTFSKAFRVIGRRDYKVMADRAFDYIKKHFHDSCHNGYWWTVDFNGEPEDRKKQIYAQSFVLYGFSEYYKISREESVLQASIELYRLIENRSWDNELGGYIEAFAEDWQVLNDVRLSAKDLNATKTMNTHLHVLEAFTNLHRIWPDKELKESLSRLIRLFENRFISKEGHLILFFDDQWRSLTSRYSYGHDIEFSWLYQEAVLEVGDNVWQRSSTKYSETMASSSIEGLDIDGGLFHEGENGQVVDFSKEWWPQAEALVGLVNIWQQTGNDYYFNVAEKVWQFIQKKLVDPEGEWFWGLDRNGKIDYSKEKAGPWKCPYHNSRAMFELLSRLPD